MVWAFRPTCTVNPTPLYSHSTDFLLRTLLRKIRVKLEPVMGITSDPLHIQNGKYYSVTGFLRHYDGPA